MKWTTGKPTVAGWYWWRNNGQAEIARVLASDLVMLCGESRLFDAVVMIGHGGGEWLGPLTPDSYQQGRVAGLVGGAQLVRWHKSCAFEADPALALERAAKDIESVASQIIQPQQAQKGGVGDAGDV